MKINNLSIAFLFSGIINLTLGIFVYVKGKKKISNRWFTIFTLQLFGWCTISFLIASTLDIKKSEFLVRFVYAYASFIPSTFFVFALSLGEDHFSSKNIKNIIWFYILGLVNTYLSFSPNFIKEIYLISPLEKANIRTGPMVRYGKIELAFYTLIIVFMLFFGLVYLYKKKKQKSGIIALEIQYVFLAVLLGTIYNVTITLIPIIFELNAADRLGPFATVIVSATMVYGITKYKIMDISWVYEKFALYCTLSFFLFLVFIISNFTLRRIGEFFLINWGNFPLFLSGFSVAFLFNPLKEKLQKFLRVKVLKYDIELFSQKILDEVLIFTDLSSLFKKLGDIIEEFLNVPPQIMLLLKKEKKIKFEEGIEFSNFEIKFSDNSLILEKLKNTKILIREEEKRFEQTYSDKKEIVKEFEKYGYEVAISLARREELLGALFLKRKKDGKVFTYRDQMLLLNLSSHLGIALENTELYRQLSEASSYIKSLLDNSPFGIISLDKEGKISLVSKQIKNFFEKEEKELIGKSFYEFLPENIIPLIERKYKDFNNEIITEEVVYRKQNRDFIFRINIVPFYDEKGKGLGIMVIFSDITRIKQLQDEIKEKEKMASLGVMAAGVAHEIKNPLVAIKTFVDLFPQRYTDPEFREVYSRLLQDEVRRINHLVEQILLFANPKPLKEEKINIGEMLKSIITLWRFQNKEKKINIEENLHIEDTIIKGDREKLKEVFLNILANSYEAVDNEKGVIGISLKRNDELVEICISDNGSGIKKEIMGKIFDPFFTTKDKGTGLGLSIVKKIVEEHGGHIKIESEENKGTKVYIEFPVIKKDI